jgi:hypothetical protein
MKTENRRGTSGANGVIGKITVAVNPAFASYVGGWPNYGGWPGQFTVSDTTHFQICVDGQHLCATPAGQHKISITGILHGLRNSPRTSGTIITGS